MNKKKTAIYIRVSVLKEDSVSPQMQLDKARQYCQLQDEEYEVFQDLDFSGKDTNRPALQRMLSQIKLGLISKVVVYRLDRLSRSVKDFALFIDALRKKNVEFYSITEHFDTSTPPGRAMINIMAVFAQMERELISQRVFDTKAKQKADGIKLGMPPYGYRLKVGKHCKWGIIPQEARIVKQVFRMYATGKWSYKSLATYLNGKFKREREKLPGQCSWGGGQYTKDKWQPGTINCIVRNLSYTGLLSPNLGIMARNLKPIISYELYRQCEVIRNKRSPRHMQYQHATTSDYPLKGKIYCSCGWPMGIRRYKSPEIYYACRNFHIGRHSHHARTSMLFQDILGYLRTCKLDRGLIQEAKQKLAGNDDGTEAERSRLVKHLQRSYERLQEQYIDGEISKSFLKRKTDEIKMRLRELQPKMGSCGRIALLEDIPTIIHKLNELGPSDAQKYREEVMDLFVEKVVWKKDHITSLKIYDEFANLFPGPYCSQREVSARGLIEVYPDRKPTIYQIRQWNYMGLLPDTGRHFSKAKRYQLDKSLKRVRRIMCLCKLGYSLKEIGRLLKGETVPVKRCVIARKLRIPRDVAGYWLRRLAKPVGMGWRGALLYDLEASLKILQDRDRIKYSQQRQT